jgi:prepilin signal peptidase PulO-like enzyme (type II secretory pathway)
LRDNIPVLGWILLRGRCRSCGCQISPGYPLVEFAVGAAFALLAWCELATGGANLPPRTEAWKPLVAGLPFDWVLLGVWLYHVTLVSILTAMALIEFNGTRPTRGFYIFAFCAGLLPPLAWPELHVMFASKMNRSAWTTTDVNVRLALQYLVFGAMYGTCLGWSYDPRRSERQRVIQLAAALGAVGLFLGDAAVSIVACMVAATLVLQRMLLSAGWIAAGRVPHVALVLLGTLTTIVFWLTLRGVGRPLESGARAMQGAAVLGACALLAILFHAFGRKPPQ